MNKKTLVTVVAGVVAGIAGIAAGNLLGRRLTQAAAERAKAAKAEAAEAEAAAWAEVEADAKALRETLRGIAEARERLANGPPLDPAEGFEAWYASKRAIGDA